MATLDLLYEVEWRGLHCMWVPSIFAPLVRTRMEADVGIRETQHLSKLQWQVIMKAWAVASRIGLQTIQKGEKLSPDMAQVIAQAMKDWALEKGASHFTHWFMPMTGATR